MGAHVLNLVTIGLIVFWLVRGALMVLGAGRRGGSQDRGNGAVLIFALVPALLVQSALVLGWPRGVRLAIDAGAVVLMVAGFVCVGPPRWLRRGGRQERD